MGVIPRLKSFRREDYAEAPEWFARFLANMSPFVGDVTSALSGGLDSSNLGKQFADVSLTTANTLEDTFAPGKVTIKNRLGVRPRSVTLGKCQPRVPPTYAQETWTPLSLVNSWVTLDAVNAVPSYKITHDGWVKFRGVVKNGAVPSTIATVPAGFRPTYATRIALDSNSAFGKVTIDRFGVVAIAAGSTTQVALDQITYEAAAGSWVGLGPFGPPIWSLTQNGTVQINYVSGLSPLTEYDLTFVLE